MEEPRSLWVGWVAAKQLKKEKKKGMNGLVVRRTICLQIKIYSVTKSCEPGGERMKL